MGRVSAAVGHERRVDDDEAAVDVDARVLDRLGAV